MTDVLWEICEKQTAEDASLLESALKSLDIEIIWKTSSPGEPGSIEKTLIAALSRAE